MKWGQAQGFERGLFAVACVGALALGCESKESKLCSSLVKNSETRLVSMNGADKKSVSFTLDGLNDALAACKKADNKAAVTDISDAQQNVKKHLERLQKMPEQPKVMPLAAQVDLEKDGDPSCPAGQAYQHPLMKKLISCSGPALVALPQAALTEYFARSKFEIESKEQELVASKDGIKYQFHFATAESDSSAICFEVTAPADKKAEELVAFVVNVPLKNIKKDQPLVLQKKEQTWSSKAAGKNQLITVGDCSAKEPLVVASEPEAVQNKAEAEEAAQTP